MARTPMSRADGFAQGNCAGTVPPTKLGREEDRVAKAKKKLLPKDFDALLEAGDLDTLKAVFDSCDVNARGGYTKQTALAFRGCPDELTRWLVEQGADLSA